MTEQEAIIFIQNAMEQSRKALAELMLLNGSSGVMVG